jgi:predicted oxidoreductase
LKTTLLCLLLTVSSWVSRNHAGVAAPQPTNLIVVGAGISGLCAALEAARGGAKVTVLDAGSVFGGHAVMSSGMVCLVDTPEQQACQVVDSPELASEDFLRFGEDANAEWVRFYTRNCRREVRDWLQELGITDWELYPLLIPGNSVRRQHVAKGRGLGLVSPIYRACLGYTNLSFIWNTRVTSLIAESGRIVGVKALDQRTQRPVQFRASFVILATGGFESSLDLVRAYWPRYFPNLNDSTRVLLGSGINSLGNGLQIASDAGASLTRLDHQLFYSTGLVDPREPSGWRGLHAFDIHSIWVNAQGRRFVRDGAPDPKLQMPAVLKQRPATYWAIFDASSRGQFFVSGSDWKDPGVVQRDIFNNPKLAPWIKTASSLEDLSQAAGLPVESLAKTVRRWNKMIDAGRDSDFHRFGPSDPKPVKIEQPPYYAIQFFPLARKSLGGVAVDLSCRVLDARGRPIPRLYAVGELTGVGCINGKAALEGTMLGPSILMGRVAAKDILPQLEHLLNAVSRTALPEPARLPQPRATDPESLQSWREVLRQLITKPRPGYHHFEKVHGVVLDRGYDCARCHGSASPLALTETQLDRRALIQACPNCHGGVEE